MVKAVRPSNDSGKIYATVISPPPARTTAASVAGTTRRTSRPVQQQPSRINPPFRPHHQR